jgi:subtilase family serine protease
LTFTPGQTSKTVTVNVTGDTVVEPDETFFVNLSAASGATIADAQGLGTILNDDGSSQQQPDFVVTQIKVSPASPTTSRSTFSATVTVKNQGTSAGNAGYLDVWANQPAAQTCPANGNGYVNVGTLAAGESRTFTVNGLPTGAAGTKTLRAFVDSYCQTVESNEANNQSTLTYTVSGQAAPDFVVTSITLNPASPSLKGTFSATVTVKNQGAVAGDAGYLDVWANQPATQTCPADGDTYATVGSLAAGESRTFTLDGLQVGNGGTKTFRAYVDSYCQTSEANEGNNQSTLPYSVAQ